MKKIIFLFSVFCLVLCAAASPKYIFLFIGDGMSIPQRMLAEEYAVKVRGTKICFNHFPYQGVTSTYSSSSYITDSAAAATAIACGKKTKNYMIGVDPAGNKLESVAYAAKKAGRKVGIISSIYINHATPAGFYGNRTNRNMYYELGLDMVASGFDFFGGGSVLRHNDPKSKEYKGDVYELAEKAGYKVVLTAAEMRALKSGGGKTMAFVPAGYLKYGLDRGDRENNPALAEYVSKAIELLDNQDGFFIMAEGGLIDIAGHANDAATNMEEVADLDAAVRVALEFAEKHRDDTLIVVTGDHETGGMTMGFAGSGNHLNVERLGFQKVSTGNFAKIYSEESGKKENFSFEDAKVLLEKYYGFKFTGNDVMAINAKELEVLKEGFEKKRIADAARRVMMGKAGVGWNTGGHTSLPVLTTAQGKGAEKFQGMMENTDIAVKLRELLK